MSTTYLSKTEQRAMNEPKKRVSDRRYKYFLEFIKDEYSDILKNGYKHIIFRNYKDKLFISIDSLRKYIYRAIRDNIVSVLVLDEYDAGKGIVYKKTYSIKNKVCTKYTVDLTKLDSVLDVLNKNGVVSDWVTNHLTPKYMKYLADVRKERFEAMKMRNKIKPGSEKYEKVRLDAHMYTKDILYNPVKLKEALNIKYPFVVDIQKEVEELNNCLPEKFKNKFEFNFKKGGKNNLFLKSASLRMTNPSCNSLSNSKLEILKNKSSDINMKNTRAYICSENNLIENYGFDTKSSIIRLYKSLLQNKWVDENEDCYIEILKLYINKYIAKSGDDILVKDKNGGTQIETATSFAYKSREAFKKLTLSMFFAGSCSMAKRNLKSNINCSWSSLGNKCESLFLTLNPNYSIADKSDDKYKKDIELFLERIAECFYEYIAGDSKEKSMSNEIFLWESVLTHKMMKYLMELHKDDEIKPICFQVYDSIYTNFKVNDFRDIRKNIFTNEILPLYKQYTCYGENDKIQTEKTRLYIKLIDKGDFQ